MLVPLPACRDIHRIASERAKSVIELDVNMRLSMEVIA